MNVGGRTVAMDFMKIAVNVAREAPGGPNNLTALLRDWFGPEAGRPGTWHHVRLTPGPPWRLEPVSHTSAEKTGPVGGVRPGLHEFMVHPEIVGPCWETPSNSRQCPVDKYRSACWSNLDWSKSMRPSWGDAMESDWTILPLSRGCDRSTFASGVTELDEWLQLRAGQAERRHNARTFVAAQGRTRRVIGYYSLVSYRLEPEVSISLIPRPYAVPALLLARLAVDRQSQGLGIGSALLLDAIRRTARVSLEVGFEVLVVHAVDARAAEFYRQRGFMPFDDQPQHLFLTTKQIRRTLKSV